jgi:hypothetical protein
MVPTIFRTRHGSKSWKAQTGYHRQSLNEAVMFLHPIFLRKLDAGTSKNQKQKSNSNI